MTFKLRFKTTYYYVGLKIINDFWSFTRFGIPIDRSSSPEGMQELHGEI